MLLDFGAAVDGCGAGQWLSPLRSALVFGFRDAARALVARGATVDNVMLAAGLGRADDVQRMLATATAVDRHGALAMAAMLGHAEVVRLLLDAGESPDRYNPAGFHPHTTPLHQAAFAGHDETVRLLVGRGARLDLCDKLWHGTPLGWAEYAGKRKVADWLRARGTA
jgi:ankyrin repeat protein